MVVKVFVWIEATPGVQEVCVVLGEEWVYFSGMA